MKNIWFLAGLPRSGATLLSSILNQNPDMWVSPASPLFRLMSAEVSVLSGSPENIDYPRNEAIVSVLQGTGNLFYYDKAEINIGDKNLNWQTPLGVELASALSAKPKIICPVRSIPEILASFENIISSVKGNENNFLDQAMLSETLPIGSIADRRAEWMMRYDKDIQICLNGMKLALNNDLRHMFHFVEYDDLVADTANTINKIYDFLELDKFDHEYANITDPTGISEESQITGIKYLHKVRPKIERKSVDPSDVLSPDVVRRYSGLEFWREI